MATPRPWSPEVEPTPEELSAWLIACTEEERVHFAALALETQRRAVFCVAANHEAAIQNCRCL